MRGRRAVTGLVAAGLALSATPAGAEPTAPADAFSDQVLARHNTPRAQYGAGALRWNAALYPSTEQYARQCRFAHSDPQGRYGENLYASSDLTAGIAEAMAAWMSEASKYDYANPGFSAATGHFTQVVWKSTTQVTASVVRCPAGAILAQPTVFVVARYTPPGNYLGQFQQNVGRYLG